MLTQSEKQWLARRMLYEGVNLWSHYSCQYCKNYGVARWDGYHHPCGVSVIFGGCPKVNPDRYDMQDAAEFEARVAARLAEAYMYVLHDAPGDHVQDMPCDDCPATECKLDCKASILKWAQIDAEMDK